MTPMGYQNLHEIDVNPSGTASYKRVGDGLTTATPANNESVDTKGYLDDDGGQTSNVTGFQYSISYSGDRIRGDDAQDYIFGKLFSMGEARRTNYRNTWEDGTVITGTCVFTEITPPGGDANAVQACGFTIRYDGKPTLTAPVAATALDASVLAGSAIGTTKFTATPAGTNTLAYRLASAAVTANNREYVDIGYATAYTSAANIPAAVGQFLAMYEIDTYKHVVKFLCEELEAADVKTV